MNADLQALVEKMREREQTLARRADQNPSHMHANHLGAIAQEVGDWADRLTALLAQRAQPAPSPSSGEIQPPSIAGPK